MSFAVPSALLLAAFAAPIVVFYILKVRLRRVPVPTNMFWKQIYDEKPPRSIWQYLRHLLSLLAQLFVLALLVLAVADPYLPWQLLQARRIVAVIDNSASMRAADVAPTRFETARADALELVDGLRFRDELAIVVAGPSPEVIVGMSSHTPTLKRALRQIEPSDNPTNLASAVELGQQLLGKHPRGQVVVFTDGCVDSKADVVVSVPTTEAELLREPLKENEPGVEYRVFATPARNLGIAQFQVRRSLVDAVGYEVLVTVLNASDDAVECRLELDLNDVPVDVLPLQLQSNEKWTRSLQKTSLEGGRLTAKLTQIGRTDTTNSSDPERGEFQSIPVPLNTLDTDDTAWAILPERKTQKVLLATEGNLFLQKVFEANPQTQIEVRSAIPERLPADTLVVLHRQVPEQLPPGNVLVVDPAGDCSDWELGEILEDPIVTQQDKDSPLMTHVRLDNVLMPEARKLVFKELPEVLAGTLTGDAVYAAIHRESGKCLVLTVNLDRGDLAFRTAFPIMVANALSWFAGAAGELRPSVATGGLTEFALDEAVDRNGSILMLRSPSGREMPVARQAAATPSAVSDEASTDCNANASASKKTSIGPFDQCGVWRLVVRDFAGRDLQLAELAVNLANARESDLRPNKEFAAERNSTPRLAVLLSRPLWYYLVLCACAATVVEWFMYQRRIIT